MSLKSTFRDFCQDYLDAFALAIGQASINSQDLRSLQIVLPPLPEQQRIAANLTEQLAEVEHLQKSLKYQLDAINKLPATLLHRAFNGEL